MLKSIKSRRYANRRGAAMYEAAIGTAVFILVLFGAIDLVRLGYAFTALQFSLSSVQRNIIMLQGNSTQSREELVKISLRESARDYGLEINNSDIRVCAIKSENIPNDIEDVESTCLVESAGSNDDYITIIANIGVKSYLSGLTFKLKNWVFAHNEPVFS